METAKRSADHNNHPRSLRNQSCSPRNSLINSISLHTMLLKCKGKRVCFFTHNSSSNNSSNNSSNSSSSNNYSNNNKRSDSNKNNSNKNNNNSSSSKYCTTATCCKVNHRECKGQSSACQPTHQELVQYPKPTRISFTSHQHSDTNSCHHSSHSNSHSFSNNHKNHNSSTFHHNSYNHNHNHNLNLNNSNAFHHPKDTTARCHRLWQVQPLLELKQWLHPFPVLQVLQETNPMPIS